MMMMMMMHDNDDDLGTEFRIRGPMKKLGGQKHMFGHPTLKSGWAIAHPAPCSYACMLY